MYAVGRPHPLKPVARRFFMEAHRDRVALCVSAEVLQELAHAYLPRGRREAFDAALDLASRADVEVWPLEEADIVLARRLHDEHPALQARDLCHLASCRRRGVRDIATFDRDLAAAAGSAPIPVSGGPRLEPS